jgi:hypothetical protein
MSELAVADLISAPRTTPTWVVVPRLGDAVPAVCCHAT